MPQTPNYKKSWSSQHDSQTQFCKIGDSCDKFSPSNVFPPFGNHNSCSLEHFFFNIFILTKCGAILLFSHVGVCGPYTQL